MDCKSAAMIVTDLAGIPDDAVLAALEHVQTCDAPTCEAKDLLWAEAFLRANRHLLAELIDPTALEDDLLVSDDRLREMSGDLLARMRAKGLLESTEWQDS